MLSMYWIHSVIPIRREPRATYEHVATGMLADCLGTVHDFRL